MRRDGGGADLAAEHAGPGGLWRRTLILLIVVAATTSGLVAACGTISFLVQDIAGVVVIGVATCVLETRLIGHLLVVFVCRGRRSLAVVPWLLVRCCSLTGGSGAVPPSYGVRTDDDPSCALPPTLKVGA